MLPPDPPSSERLPTLPVAERVITESSGSAEPDPADETDPVGAEPGQPDLTDPGIVDPDATDPGPGLPD